MKKQSLITIILILLISMIETSLFAHDFAVTNSDGVTIYYEWANEEKTEVAVSYYSYYYSAYYSGNINIPETVEYGDNSYDVTSIGSNAFISCTSLTSVTIPNSVTKIGYKAFSGCIALSSIHIPNSVTTIENQAFEYCVSLSSIDIPNSVTTIEYRAFYNCSTLSSINIPKSITSIGSEAFNGTAWYNNQPNGLLYVGKVAYKYYGEMPSNSNITIKDGTTQIAAFAFSEYANLVSISIPNSVSSIENYAFYGCCSLTSLYIPVSVTFIGEKAFAECSNLSTLTLESNANINNKTFEGCNCLTTVSFNNEYVGSCFKGFTSINEVIFGNHVNSIADDAFKGCTGLRTINLPNNLTTIGYRAFQDLDNLTSVSIPNSVNFIGSEAFSGCSGLATINIPNSLKVIYDMTFAGCTGLTSITIPNSVESIYGNPFYGCSGLSSIVVDKENPYYDSRDDCNAIIHTSSNELVLGCKNSFIPNDISSIGYNAFGGCSGLSSITIPSSVTNISFPIFSECASLNSIVVEEDNPKYDSRNNCNAIVITSTNELANGCNNTIIPNDISSIRGNAFNRCGGLTSIMIPGSVTSIDDFSFYECTGLASIVVDQANSIYDSRNNCNAIIETANNRLIVASNNVVIPETVTSYNQNTFKNCISLSLPDGLETISSNMFEGCIKLESIRIPGSVKTIDSGAFLNCTSLKNVIFEEGNDPLVFKAYSYYYINWFEKCPLEIITIGRNIEYDISYTSSIYNSMSPFREKETLTEVVFSDKVSSIPNGMFSGCRNLAAVQLPERMDYIGSSAFYDCENLVTISLPDGIKDIGNSTFYGCKKIPSITIPNSVETIGESAFYSCEAIPSITIPNSVTIIARGAFQSCINLSFLSFEDGEEPLTIRQENSYIDAFSDCPISSIYLGRDIVNDSYNYIYSSLASFTTPFDLTISKNVKTLSGGTFANCEKIKTLTLEEGDEVLTLVNDHNAYNSIMPFANTPIESVYMGRVVVGTDNYYPNNTITPFANVGSSFTMRVGENITEIEEGAYAGWMVSSLIIPNNVLKVGVDAIGNCTHLTSVTIEDGTKDLSINNNFLNSPLDEVYVGRNITYPEGNSPFSMLESLKKVTIGSQVSRLGDTQFAGCQNLKDVVSHALNVPSTGQHVFTEAYQAEAKLHVPENAYIKYQNTYPWYLFKNFQLIDENGTETPKTIVSGDASGNGIVDAGDIDEIVRYIMGDPSGYFNFGNADMNKDGKVNAIDIVALNNLIKNLQKD